LTWLLTGGISMRAKLTPAFIAKAKAAEGAERTIYWDASLPGFGLMVTASGHRSYVVQYRHRRRSRRLTLDGVLKPLEARKEAKALLGRVAKGGDPLEERRREQRNKADAFDTIGREYLDREAKSGLRSIGQNRSVLERLIFPELGTLQIGEIKKSDVIRLLDKVGDRSGPAMARQTFAVLRRVLSWHEARDDHFSSPIKRGMARDVVASPKARDRILDDDELRALWRATEASAGPFGALVRFLLLTGARRSEALGMRWGELNGEGADWVLPASRNKVGRDLVRPLSGEALAVLKGLPRVGDFVFSLNGKAPIGAVSTFKRCLDETSGVTGWTLHDLRRTARSLMARAGVAERHAEECLGHIQGGVKATYDRHKYYDEKKRAYEMLAAQVQRIVNPQANVVPLRGGELPAYC
jgi:integrase